MFRITTCVVAVLLFASIAHADNRRSRRRYTTPTVSTPVTKSYAYTGATSTAQGVAELQANYGRVGHHGGNTGDEGVGSGFTPEQALGNCCYSNSGMRVVDQGVAQGRDGRWYACKRYR